MGTRNFSRLNRIALANRFDDFRVLIPLDELSGRLAPFNNRARIILVHLLKGWSRGMSAVQAGVGRPEHLGWARGSKRRIPGAQSPRG